MNQNIGSEGKDPSMIASSKRNMFNNLCLDFGLTTQSDNADVGVEQMSNVRLQYDGNMVQDGTQSKSDVRSNIQECEEKRNWCYKALLKNPPVKKKSRNIPKRTKSSYQLYIFNVRPILRKKNREMTSPDITMLLKRMGKEISPEDRKTYDNQAASSLEQHKVEMVKWDVEHLEKVNTENVNRATEALPDNRAIFQ